MKKEESSSKSMNSSDKENKKGEEDKENEEEKITVQQFGENPNLLQIIKGNGYYLLNRDNFDITRIMMMIDYPKLSILGDFFRNYESPDGEDGVIKIDFINMIYEQLKGEIKENEKTDLVYGIHKYFCEIDFNGDGHMEWAEFTQFIIDKVEGEYSNSDNEEDSKEKRNLGKNIIKYKRYELSQNIIDYNIHKSDVVCARFMNKINRLLISEYNKYIIKIYNPLTAKIENTIDIHKINDDIEKVKIEELLRDQKNAKQVINETNRTKIQKSIKPNSINKILGHKYVRKKLHEQKVYGKNYSIINFTTHGSVIAVLLSCKQIQFFTIVNTIKGELLYEINTKSLQKRIWYLENHNLWFTSGDKEYDDEYYYLNELDIDFQMKEGFPMPISKNMGYRRRFCRLSPHKGEIYDVIEIKKPYVILTACLDGYIRLINVSDSEFIKTWKRHSLGVKHLDYNPNLEINGYIISTGFEYYINIFNTDLSLDDSYKGKLEGHFVPVINCRFICGSPICVSVDEEGNARIWDIILRTCLQSIPISRKNFSVSGLLMMNKINKFIIYGNTILTYDSKYREEKQEKNDGREDINYPIQISFNKYYQQFYITTNKDIRIFNKNGNLEKIFRKCIENENFDNNVKIRTFLFEDNHRKFFLGFSNGAIMQYNAGNGSLIKIINQYEVEKDGIIFYKFLHTKDVSSLYFFHQKRDYEKDNLLLISSSIDSTIQVYNEYFLETTTKLRTIKGGHTIGDKKCEIICMDFSDNLCQLATGSTEGLITIWDFEMSKIKEVFYFNHKVWGVKIDVICLKYLNNYPLLFSSYTEGICCLWGVQPLDKSIKLILKFHNFYQTSLKLDLCDVLCCYFLEGVIKDVEQQFLNKKYFVDTPEFIKERKKKRFDQITGDELPLITRDELEKESIIDESLDPFTYQDIYDKYDKDTATKIKHNIINNEESQYMVICDRKGFIKLLNLKGVFRKYRNVLINPESYHVLGSNFNILKKDDTNVESFVSHLIHLSSTDGVKYYKQLFHNLYAINIISREWKGHLDAINDITFIEEPISLVTISKDMYMRIWDEKFELVGEINIFPSEIKDKSLKKAFVPWNFKINEEKIIGKEINEVVEIFENVGLEPVIFGSKKDKENSKLKIMKKEEVKTRKKKETDMEEDNRQKRLEEMRKKNSEVKKEEFEYVDGYEMIFLKNLTSNIEYLLDNKLAKEGMGEISNNLMSSIIEHQNIISQRKKREKENSMKNKKKMANKQSLKLFHNYVKNTIKRSKFLNLEVNSEKDQEHKSQNIENEIKKNKSPAFYHKLKKNLFSPTKFINSLIGQKSQNNIRDSSKENSTKINKDSESNLIDNKNEMINFNSRLKSNQRKFDPLLKLTQSNSPVNNSNNNNILSNPNISPNNKIFPTPFSQRNYSRNNFLKESLSSDYLKRNPGSIEKNRPTTVKESHLFAANYIPPNLNRNNLYSEKLFSRLPLKSPERKNIFPNLNAKLSKIGSKNNLLNFNLKEKTENLLKKQFYLNSYKNSCQILPNNNSLSTNTSLLINYKNMWNNVKLYTDIIKKKHGINNKKTNQNQIGRSRSVTALKRKIK